MTVRDAHHMTCYHPYGKRRVYRVGDARTEVCRNCCACRADDGFWPPVTRWITRDGHLRTINGLTLYRSWVKSSNL